MSTFSRLGIFTTLAVAASSASAALTVGQIRFAGFINPIYAADGITLTSLDVGGAFGEDKALVVLATGDFAPFDGQLASYYDVSLTGPTSPLWEVGSYSFNMDALTVVENGGTYLNLAGSGFVVHPVNDPTPMEWTFTSTDVSGQGEFRFFTDGAIVVPEPSGLTIFGLGLAGLLLRRRRRIS